MKPEVVKRLASLDHQHFDDAATWAAASLADRGVALVRLAPGDATEYRIAVVAPGVEWAYGEPRQGKYFWVTLCSNFGCGYEWHGGDVHGDYAAEKWVPYGATAASREWTGAIIARFLSALSAAMHTEKVAS